MSIVYHTDFDQGSLEWLNARRGLITASEVKHIITPTLKVAKNDKSRSHAYELAAQRITGYVEPSYISDDMLRGMDDEITARALYQEHYGDVTEVGLITNDIWGFTIAYSPDGVVGEDGLIEVKSRKAKYQIETIASDEVPQEYMLQLQTGLLVTGRKWIDFISYSGGLPMFTKRVLPDPDMHQAIIAATTAFESEVAGIVARFEAAKNDNGKRLIPTERKEQREEIIV